MPRVVLTAVPRVVLTAVPRVVLTAVPRVVLTAVPRVVLTAVPRVVLAAGRRAPALAACFGLALAFGVPAAFFAADPRIDPVRVAVADMRRAAGRAVVCTGIDLPPY